MIAKAYAHFWLSHHKINQLLFHIDDFFRLFSLKPFAGFLPGKGLNLLASGIGADLDPSAQVAVDLYGNRQAIADRQRRINSGQGCCEMLG